VCPPYDSNRDIGVENGFTTIALIPDQPDVVFWRTPNITTAFDLCFNCEQYLAYEAWCCECGMLLHESLCL
jgi:hypothetical protein